MARYTGPKRRLSRREGLPLTGKDIKALERKGALPPGQHGARMRRRVSEFGLQLREKQKAKRFYGIFWLFVFHGVVDQILKLFFSFWHRVGQEAKRLFFPMLL